MILITNVSNFCMHMSPCILAPNFRSPGISIQEKHGAQLSLKQYKLMRPEGELFSSIANFLG